jgi:hypothetical protein
LKDKKEHIDKEYLSAHHLKLYREGKMSHSEMRRIEGLLEKYPLYAEALEGLSLLNENQIEKHTTFLQENIQAKVGKKKPTKTVFIYSTNVRKIAATLLVLIIFSSGLYFLNNLINKEVAPEENMAVQSTFLEDSIQSSVPLLTDEAMKERLTEPSTTETKVIEQKGLIHKNKSKKYTKEKSYDVPLVTEVTPPAPISNPASISDSIQLAMRAEESSTDDLSSSEPVKPNTEEKVVPIESKTEDTKKTEKEANKRNRLSAEVIGRALKLAPTTSEEQKNYINSLLTKHLRNFAKEKNETLRGKLLVTFSLNHLYQVQNISVKESPCPSCESEIIKWLQDYKNWQDSYPGQQRIEILFD